MTEADAALLELLRRLDALGYDFVTVTPATHARVVARRGRGRDLRDALGWSLPVPRDAFPGELFELLREAGVLAEDDGRYRSSLRVSRIDGRLFLHSAYPTDDEKAVFLGPDSWRFVRFLKSELSGSGTPRRLVDMGAGAGVGALCAAALVPSARLSLIDTNGYALRLARINAAVAGIEIETASGIEGGFDLFIANPPYIQDDAGRAYRHGGGMLGAEISLRWALDAARRIDPGGRILLYTGSSIVAGRDALRAALEERLAALGCSLRYEEIDPDLFGEELDRPAYSTVERIAAIGAVIERPA